MLSEREYRSRGFEPAWMSVRLAALELAVTEWTIRNWLRTGVLEYERFGPRTIRIPATAVYRRKRADANVTA
jgi:excisionase family DNA binding protein